jgi:hypothetical protein
VASGAIYRHEAFYRSAESGRLEPKYLVLLATLPSDDLVARLLTSRSYGRPEDPPCFHGRPYPSFYLGLLGGPLRAKSWVDLRVLVRLLDCVAAAEDTTRLQEQTIRDELSRLR